MPNLVKSPPTCHPLRRSASAMLVTPMVRSKPIVAFRKAAITSGPERLRIRLASSPIVTSRTWCERFSTDQCPLTHLSNWPAPATDLGTLVMK